MWSIAYFANKLNLEEETLKLLGVGIFFVSAGFFVGRFLTPKPQLSLETQLVAVKWAFSSQSDLEGKVFLKRKSECLLSDKPFKIIRGKDSLLLLIRLPDAGALLTALAKEPPLSVNFEAFSNNPSPPCGQLTRLTYGTKEEG